MAVKFYQILPTLRQTATVSCETREQSVHAVECLLYYPNDCARIWLYPGRFYAQLRSAGSDVAEESDKPAIRSLCPIEGILPLTGGHDV